MAVIGSHIRSMQADVPNHEPSLMLMNCGDARLPRPSFGAWATYGLGTENQNLPGFLVMCSGGYPIVSTQNWRAAFLPGAYQGTYLDTQHKELDKLIANIKNAGIPLADQRKQLDLVRALNEKHAAERQRAPLEARIESFGSPSGCRPKRPKHSRHLPRDQGHARRLRRRPRSRAPDHPPAHRAGVRSSRSGAGRGSPGTTTATWSRT
jgi:hypothetical protein